MFLLIFLFKVLLTLNIRQGQLIVRYKYAIQFLFTKWIFLKHLYIFTLYWRKACNFILVNVLPLFQYCTKNICKYFWLCSLIISLGRSYYYKIALISRLLYDITEFNLNSEKFTLHSWEANSIYSSEHVFKWNKKWSMKRFPIFISLTFGAWECFQDC